MVVAHWAGYHYIITSKTPRCWWKYCNDFDSIFYIQVLSSLHHLPNLAKMPKILTVDLAHEEQCGTGAGNDGKAADLVLYQALDMEGGEVAFPWYNFYVRVYLFRLYAVSDSRLLRVWLRFWLCLWLWFKLVLNGVVIGRLAVVVTGDLFIEKTVVLTTVVFCATAVWFESVSHHNLPYRHTAIPHLTHPVVPSVALNSRDTFLFLQAELSSTSPALSETSLQVQSAEGKTPKRKVTGPRYEKLQLLVTKQKCSRLAAGNHNHPFVAKP